MFKKIIAMTLLISPLSIGRPNSGITLVPPQTKTTAIIGHTYVFAGTKQTTYFSFPTSERVTAQLYRTAGNILAATGEPIRITPKKNTPSPVSIDLPKSDQPTHYILVFDTKNKARLHITALPTDYLAPLRQAARNTPLALIDPPEGLVDVLRQLSIPSRIQNTPLPPTEGMLIVYRTSTQPTTKYQAKRTIIIDSTYSFNKEVWVQEKKDSWKITVPASYFTPESLLTAHGQYRLKKLLLDSPNSL